MQHADKEIGRSVGAGFHMAARDATAANNMTVASPLHQHAANQSVCPVSAICQACTAAHASTMLHFSTCSPDANQTRVSATYTRGLPELQQHPPPAMLQPNKRIESLQ